jgi:hypothetical protein
MGSLFRSAIAGIPDLALISASSGNTAIFVRYNVWMNLTYPVLTMTITSESPFAGTSPRNRRRRRSAFQ